MGYVHIAFSPTKVEKRLVVFVYRANIIIIFFNYAEFMEVCPLLRGGGGKSQNIV